MRLIESSFEIIEQQAGLEGVYKQIELIGRVCTKSEDKITEDSAEKFIDNLIKLNHGSPLEHGTVYLFIPLHCDKTDYHIAKWYYSNPYSRVNVRNEHYCFDSNGYYITTNLRVLVENNLIEHLKFICEPTELHEKRVCVKFILPIGISREFCRHRVFSFMEMSTRYVNMSGNKVGNEITFIEPDFEDPFKRLTWRLSMGGAESNYNNLIKAGCKPQEARDVLPLATKTELYMTGFISDWKSFFELRSNKYGRGGAHPQADELATPLYEEFKKRGYI